MMRRYLPRVIAAWLSLAALHSPARAQDYPNRPITLVVPFVPGGSTSTVARIVTDRMSQGLGQPIVIENRGGAGSSLGARGVAKAAPDGYTILEATNATLGVAPNIYANVGYDPRKDFAFLGMIGAVPNVLLVLPSYPAHTFAELLALARKSDKPIEYGTPGIGTVNHLAAELLAREAKIKLAHVPYRGAGPALNDLLGGHIPLLFSAVPNIHGHVQAGTVRPLAVTSSKRSSMVPDVPTIAESGFPGFDMSLSFGFVAPAGTPASIVERLNRELVAALADEGVKKRLAAEGLELSPSTPQEHAADIEREIVKGAALVKSIGLKPKK
jgi:tripartite-type tricarboxylate transporter receptor subunit TctC